MAELAEEVERLARLDYPEAPPEKNGDTDSSAIAEHAWQYQHQIDWTASEVLDYSQYWSWRCMLESWHIHHQSDLNRERGPLPYSVPLTMVVNIGHLISHTHLPYACMRMRNHHFIPLLTSVLSLCILHSLTRTPE